MISPPRLGLLNSVSEQVGDPDFDLDDRVPVGSFILALRPSARFLVLAYTTASLPDASGKEEWFSSSDQIRSSITDHFFRRSSS